MPVLCKVEYVLSFYHRIDCFLEPAPNSSSNSCTFLSQAFLDGWGEAELAVVGVGVLMGVWAGGREGGWVGWRVV